MNRPVFNICAFKFFSYGLFTGYFFFYSFYLPYSTCACHVIAWLFVNLASGVIRFQFF